MKSVSVVVTYYNSPMSLQRHLDAFEETKKLFDGDLELVVVDDGSQTHAAKDVINQNPQSKKFTKLFRIQDDIPWNHRSARNIGAFEASNEWLLLLDIDTVISPKEFVSQVSQLNPLDRQFFMLPRKHSVDGYWMKVHHDTLLIRRSLFWEIRGYDENFAGYWGAGSFWLRRAEKLAQKISGKEIKFLEWIGDEVLDSQTKFIRENTLWRRIKIRLIRASLKIGLRRHKQLSFPYFEIQ